MPEIVRLKIQLDKIKPAVVRRIEVPGAIRLDDLHLVIQAAMGWGNSHLFEFRIGNKRWGISEPGWSFGDGPLSAAKATLDDLIANAPRKTFKYLYDFGDDWEHTIKAEATAEAEVEVLYPRLLSARNRCPPEDIGGPWGYVEYLQAIADPNHERHGELVEWGGPGFDPAQVDEGALRRQLDGLARKLAPRKSKPPARPRSAAEKKS